MRIRNSLGVLVVALVAAAALVLPTAAPGAQAASPGAASAYVPLDTPQRLLDTRLTTGPLGRGATTSVTVSSGAPLPSPGSVTAAVLNLTVVAPAGVGFFTVWPRGVARPTTSNLNIDEIRSLSGGAVANLVTVPVGPDGIVDVFSSGGGNVVVDLLGYYTPAATATAGRFTPLAAPTRILDTRGAATFAPNEARRFVVPGAVGASAVAVNVTAVNARAGFWRLYAHGATAPTTSNVNSPGWLIPVANQAIVPVDAQGAITIFSNQGGDVIIDLVGSFTGAAAPASTAGLFVPLAAPTRIVDTRDPARNPLGGTTSVKPGWTIEVPVTSNPVVGRPDVAAVVVNATAAQTFARGFVTVGTAGAVKPGTAPTTSTMNIVRPAQVLANHAIVPISTRGFSMYTKGGGNLIADLAGYYLGAPASAPFGKPVNAAPAACWSPTVGYPTTPVGPIVVGSSPKSVAALQNRLLALGFWVRGADGVYGLTTVQAVMAFQKWKGLPATTVVDAATATALNNHLCRPVGGTTSGTLFEVDKGKQIAYVIQNGQVRYVFNVSTGDGKRYDEPNQKYGGRVIGVALTPNGTYRTYREHDLARYEGDLGSLYRPKFIVGGVAVHGAPRVPNYPASHGCVRVANPVMDLIWSQNLLPLRSTVWIHD